MHKVVLQVFLCLNRGNCYWQGLDSLGYKEHLDYDLVESTNPAFNKAVVRVNVFRSHRQVRSCPSSVPLIVQSTWPFVA